ncbi:MAG TPA: FAD-binding oxidoreductase [Acidimicrobiia bacterium]|nr:FAD-binding oxidoreductase [Acidimicrobiia bacterium]
MTSARAPFMIDDLANTVTGDVITPEDDRYDQARRMFYGGMDNHPAALVRVVDTDDVIAVLRFAIELGVPFAVRSGAHSVSGSSGIDDGIVIDLCALKSIEIDLESSTVWAGAGLTAGELTNAAGEHGLALGFGDTGSVGIGGITLGGGVGFLARKYGLTIDSLLAAELVTAQGEVIVADGDNHPDLFWAIRGGGGNFGVATRFRYALHPVDRIVGGMLVLPATVEAISGFLALSDEAPEDLTTMANVMAAPPMPFLPEQLWGSTILMGLIAWAGDLDEGRVWMDRFRGLAEPLFDMLDVMPYPQIYMEEDEEYQPLAVGLTGFIDRIDDRAITRILEEIAASDAPMRVVQLRVLGGAVSRVPNYATAYGHRDRAIMVNVASFYEDESQRSRRHAWVRDLHHELTGDDEAGYVGFLGEEGEARVRAAYPGDIWDRLRAVKAKYDPHNVFARNQNIPPAE